MAVQPAGGTTSVTETGRWDRISERLHALRDAADAPSFAEVARRISEHRRAQGATPETARVARSTVYDAFRPGRTRVNLALVREIALVLGADDADVDGWFDECRRAGRVPGDEPGEPPNERVAPPTAAPLSSVDVTTRVSVVQAALFMALCVGINLVGRQLVVFLDLPVYADMIGTCVAAIVLGPWRGAAVGMTTNALGVGASGVVSLPFAAVNVVGALVWGYGVRRGRWGRSLPSYFTLNMVVAVACSVVAVPILLLIYGGSVGHSQDVVTMRMMDLTHSSLLAVGTSNLLTSLIDKLTSGFVALVIIMATVPSRYLVPLRGRLVLLDAPDTS